MDLMDKYDIHMVTFGFWLKIGTTNMVVSGKRTHFVTDTSNVGEIAHCFATACAAGGAKFCNSVSQSIQLTQFHRSEFVSLEFLSYIILK